MGETCLSLGRALHVAYATQARRTDCREAAAPLRARLLPVTSSKHDR